MGLSSRNLCLQLTKDLFREEKIGATYPFGSVGSNSINLTITKEGVPYVMEVNPDFKCS